MRQFTVSALAFVFAVSLSVTLAADLEQGNRSVTSVDTTADLAVTAGEKCDKKKKKKKCDKKKKKCDKKKKDCDKKKKDGTS